MDCNSLPNYRYELVSPLGGGISAAHGATGRTMTRWSMVVCSLAVLLLLSVSISLSGSGSIPSSAADKKRKPLSAEEVLSLSDELEFAAIQAIHSQLDDNEDGKVDLSESEEFVQTELCGEGSSGERQKVCSSSEKSRRFHQTDKHITSMELWMTWHTNEVFNWTTDDVIFWLNNHVHLPQYSETFRWHKITGRLLPKVATNSEQILQSVLLIVDSQHRQKIQLRAMDVILFGPPRSSGYWKDIIMTLSILLCVWGVLYALRQRWIAQSRIDSFLEDYLMKKEELAKLKSKLEREEMIMAETTDSGKEEEEEEGKESAADVLLQQNSSPLDEDLLSEASFSRSSSVQDPESSLYRAHEEIAVLHRKVVSLESQLETNHSSMGALQDLLRESCRREWEHLDIRKRTAEEQMTKAQKVCDKIKKRRSSLFGSLHLANSSALEEAGLQITKAVNKMQSISECFDEYHKRWRRVEHICGFQVCSIPSSPTSYAPTSSSSSSPAQKYERTFFSTANNSSNNSVTSFTTVDGTCLCQGARFTGGGGGEVVPYLMHRSSTLPRFRSKSNSLPEVDSFYYNPKSRSSSVSSSSTSSGSVALLRNLKSGSPLNRQQSFEGGDGGEVDIADCHQLVNSTTQHHIQHHQLHHSSVGTFSCKRPETDIAELVESPRYVQRQQLKNSTSVPALVRKESYSDAICNGEEGGVSCDVESDGGGGITFTISSDGSNPFSTVSTVSATPKPPTQQSLNESLKPPGYRTASNGLEAIKEERASQISLAGSCSSEASSQRGARAGSASPEKPKSKSKSRSQSPRGAAVKSTAAINHRAISSDV